MLHVDAHRTASLQRVTTGSSSTEGTVSIN